jgi:predicted  nucleic acid-binding Zn-ribbon protein
MSDYSIAELEEIIERGEDKLEELADQINDAFEEGMEANDGLEVGAWTQEEVDGVLDRYNHLCAVAEGLRERIDYLRGELEEVNAAMVADYEADYEEALEDYLAEGGELDSEGAPVDKDLFADVFNKMQFDRVENGL